MQASKRIKKTTKTNLMDKDYNFHKTQLKEIETTCPPIVIERWEFSRKSQSSPVLFAIVMVSIIYPPLSQCQWIFPVVNVLCDTGWSLCHQPQTWTKNRQCLKDRFLLTFEQGLGIEFVRFCGEAAQCATQNVPFFHLILLRFWKIAENSLSFEIIACWCINPSWGWGYFSGFM